MGSFACRLRDAAVAIAAAALLEGPAWASVPVIGAVTFDAATNRLVVEGANLQDATHPGKYPLTVFFGAASTQLAVLPGASSTRFTAQLPYAPAPGSYLLSAYTKMNEGIEEFWVTIGATGPAGPQGPAGAAGAPGPKGDAGAGGAAATIAVGTVTTGAPGSNAAVTNVGTASAAVFDFTLPQGPGGSGASCSITPCDPATATATLTCGTAAPVTLACLVTNATRVFVTSQQYPGDLGGIAGADMSCQCLATAAGLGGTWRAWLSSTTIAAVDRLPQTGLPYATLDGKAVAANTRDLVDGTLLRPIAVDERGAVVTSATVWTGTMPDGTFQGAGCAGFTANQDMFEPRGLVGDATRTDGKWTASDIQSCLASARLYCFQL